MAAITLFQKQSVRRNATVSLTPEPMTRSNHLLAQDQGHVPVPGLANRTATRKAQVRQRSFLLNLLQALSSPGA